MKCRFCAEEIQDAAVVCKHCGRDLIPGRAGSAPTVVTITGPVKMTDRSDVSLLRIALLLLGLLALFPLTMVFGLYGFLGGLFLLLLVVLTK